MTLEDLVPAKLTPRLTTCTFGSVERASHSNGVHSNGVEVRAQLFRVAAAGYS